MSILSQAYVRIEKENNKYDLIARTYKSDEMCNVDRAFFTLYLLKNYKEAISESKEIFAKTMAFAPTMALAPEIREKYADLFGWDWDDIKEWKENKIPERANDFNEYLFREQANDAGKLLIDVDRNGNLLSNTL